MKRSDIKKVLASGASIKGKETFLMPLVYFNSAKVNLELFKESKNNFETARDWFIEKVNESLEFHEINKHKEVDEEIAQFIDQWPDGLSLDITGAFEQTLPPLAETVAHFFSFLTNCVASVESSVNLKLSILLTNGEIKSSEIKNWNARGISDRTRKLLHSIRIKVLDVDTDELLTRDKLDTSLNVFEEVVRSRNQLVHYKSKPSVFTSLEINLDKITGLQNIDLIFCLKAIDAIHTILSALSLDNSPWGDTVFEKRNIGFNLGWSPSPYIQRVID